MTKLERDQRTIPLCLVVFGILLWSNTVAAATSAFQQQSNTKRYQKPAAASGLLIEQFSFSINDFKMDHQGENNNLNITIRYRYKGLIAKAEYPDFTLIARDIETLLADYPNKEDYWEIVNKRITLMVLEKYPAVTKVTSQIQVSPSPKTAYLRSSIATRDRTNTRRTPTK